MMYAIGKKSVSEYISNKSDDKNARRGKLKEHSSSETVILTNEDQALAFCKQLVKDWIRSTCSKTENGWKFTQ